ncbi:hypothetical protein Pmani_036252 [Petrolisthes manimaculis]|uniref:Uncharacterized protein n=1 Tax=Petrolisthes manimaculis TaxID=1843537 RepID=A0AAE1TPK8_9EUCA|nr:hypothetical protein Pmani_036252 [Petrolisthes manimaculis]
MLKLARLAVVDGNSHTHHFTTLSLSFPHSGQYLLTMAEDFLRDMAAREYAQDEGTNYNMELERYLQAYDADGSGTPAMVGVGFGPRQRGVHGIWDNNNSQSHHQPSTTTPPPAAAAAAQYERYNEHYHQYQHQQYQHQQYQHQSRHNTNNNGDDSYQHQHQQREPHQREHRRGRRGGSGSRGGSGGSQNQSREVVIEYVTSIYELEEGSDTARLVTNVYRPREPERRIPQQQHQHNQNQNQHHRDPSVNERGRNSFPQMFNLDPPRMEDEVERNTYSGWLGSQK